MLSADRAYTLALVGDPRHGQLNAVTLALAERLGRTCEIAAGDYLDRKNLGDRGKLFHIGCYHPNGLLLDVINCPLQLRNAAIAFCQADRIVWVLKPDEPPPELNLAIAAADAFGVQSHVLLLNAAGVDAELTADEEMLGLMEAEVQEPFATCGVQPEASFRVDIADLAGAADAASQFEELAELLTAQPVKTRSPATLPPDGVVVQVERCYAVKGPQGKPARVAFGPVRGRTLSVGDVLHLAGEDADALRVVEIEQFGRKVKSTPPGASAAVMFHGGPKDHPQSGDVLGDDSQLSSSHKELACDVHVSAGRSVSQVFASLAGVDVCIGTSRASATVSGLSENPDDATTGRLELRCAVPTVGQAGQPLLIGNRGRLLAVGHVDA